MKLTIKEVENTSTLYLPENNRCYSVTIKHNKKQETFHIYTGMGWTSIDEEFALEHLFDNASTIHYEGYVSWALETGYGEQLGYDAAYEWWCLCRDTQEGLIRVLGTELYDELYDRYA